MFLVSRYMLFLRIQNFCMITYSLRSNNSLLLEVPQEIMRQTLDAGSLTFAALALWSSLPADLHVVMTLLMSLKANFSILIHFLFDNNFNVFFFFIFY